MSRQTEGDVLVRPLFSPFFVVLRVFFSDMLLVCPVGLWQEFGIAAEDARQKVLEISCNAGGWLKSSCVYVMIKN